MASGHVSTKLKSNSYLSKVVSYIPGEIVAAYVAATGALEQAKDSVPVEILLWVVAGVLLLLTPVWILATARDQHQRYPVFSATAGTLAFACWVFALGGPFAYRPWYQPVYGTLALSFVTLIIPLAESMVVSSLHQINGTHRP